MVVRAKAETWRLDLALESRGEGVRGPVEFGALTSRFNVWD